MSSLISEPKRKMIICGSKKSDTELIQLQYNSVNQKILQNVDCIEYKNYETTRLHTEELRPEVLN